MSDSRRTCNWLMLGVALALLAGCGSDSEESRSGPPPEVAAPVAVERAESAPPVKDPAAAARFERVRQSLENGADPDKTDPAGRTALMMAAFEGYTDIVELFLDHGAEVDRRDAVGRAALMYAASGPFPETVDLLIRRGAEVDLVDTAEGRTPLMLAAAEGHQPVVELLLRHGADIRITDQDGDAALDHARVREQAHIVALLESWPEDR